MNTDAIGFLAHPTVTFSDLVPRRGSHDVLPRPSQRFHYTYNARGAIFQFLSALPRRAGRDVVLVPAFHCPTVVTPALQAGYEVRFYPIQPDLTFDEASVLATLDDRVAAVIVIDYFGVAGALHGLPEACRRSGCPLIEDASHSFLQSGPLELAGARGDAAVFSFWKIVPTVVGGALRINNPALELDVRDTPIPLRESAVRLKHILEQAVNNLDDGLMKNVFNYLESERVRLKSGSMPARVQAAEADVPGDDLFPFDPVLARAGMPLLSGLILKSANLEEVARVRRCNFQHWMERLEFGDMLRPVHAALPSRVCPWALPVILEGREQIDRQIRGRGVPLYTFGNVLHPALYRDPPRSGLEHAEYLRRNLLCLPVHQNLSEGQIAGYCDVINAFLRQRA